MVIGESLKIVIAIDFTLVGNSQPRNQLHCTKVLGKGGRPPWQASHPSPFANNAIIAKYLEAVKNQTVVKILGRAGAVLDCASTATMVLLLGIQFL